MHRCEEASGAYMHLKTTSLIRTSAAQVHRARAFHVRRRQENIVFLFVKLMEHPFHDGKINGAFEC